MNCPIDGDVLVMSERKGIEIDYCPKCRGVWLDRGELDKLIEASDRDEEKRYEKRDDERDEKRDEKRYGERGEKRYDERPNSKKKKSSFLGELFELGG